jgi:acyl carrier protein
MSLDDYNAAIRPKVQGTWNLHQLFADAKLDFFVMLSSLAGVAGNVSQANYSAGGSFQDAVARHRSARGLPGVALDLGLVKSVGYVAENEGMIPRLQRLGFNALEEEEVLRLVESALEYPLRQETDSQIVTGLRTNLTGQAVADAFWSNDRRFTGVAQVHTSQTASRGSGYDTPDLKSQLASAASSEDQVALLTVAIARKLSDMFLVPAEEISPDQSLTRYGVDSLVAVELRNWLASSTGTDPSIFEIMQSSSLKDLAARTCEKL